MQRITRKVGSARPHRIYASLGRRLTKPPRTSLFSLSLLLFTIALVVVSASSFVSSQMIANTAYTQAPAGSCVITPTSGQWSTPGPPPARYLFGEAYDYTDGYVLVFGGVAIPSDTLLSDTWSYVGGCWKQLSPTTSPPARAGMGMIWDPKNADCTTAFPADAGGCILLFGGCSVIKAFQANLLICSTDLQDTWEFYGGNWAQVTTASSPSARHELMMAFDSNPSDNYPFIFGGCSPGSNSCGPTQDQYKFVSSPTCCTWTTITSATEPSARAAAGMAYDSSTADQYVLMYGGWSGSAMDSDAWAFKAGSWVSTAVCTSCAPGARGGDSLNWSATYSKLFLVGGYTGTAELQDTWTFSAGSFSSTALCSPCSFMARSSGGLAYDAASPDGYLFEWGGCGGAGAACASPAYDQWIYK